MPSIVFLWTNLALAPGDDDGNTSDVYDLSNGTETLLSTGPLDDQSSYSSGPGAPFMMTFEGASADGSRVFLQSLVLAGRPRGHRRLPRPLRTLCRADDARLHGAHGDAGFSARHLRPGPLRRPLGRRQPGLLLDPRRSGPRGRRRQRPLRARRQHGDAADHISRRRRRVHRHSRVRRLLGRWADRPLLDQHQGPPRGPGPDRRRLHAERRRQLRARLARDGRPTGRRGVRDVRGGHTGRDLRGRRHGGLLDPLLAQLRGPRLLERPLQRRRRRRPCPREHRADRPEHRLAIPALARRRLRRRHPSRLRDGPVPAGGGHRSPDRRLPPLAGPHGADLHRPGGGRRRTRFEPGRDLGRRPHGRLRHERTDDRRRHGPGLRHLRAPGRASGGRPPPGRRRRRSCV